MRLRQILPLLLFSLLFLTACDDSHSDDQDRISDEIEELENDIENELHRAQDDIQGSMEDARDELRSVRDKLRRDRRRDGDEIERDAREGVEDILSGIGAALQDLGAALTDDSDVEVVPHSKLQDLLPGDVAGFDRVNTSGETKGAFGFHISQIEGEYESDSATMTIEIIDLGKLGNLAENAIDFADINIDSDNGTHLERTTRFGDYKALIDYDNEGQYRDFTAVIFVAERFIIKIEAEGNGIDADTIDEVVEELGLNRLKRMVD